MLFIMSVESEPLSNSAFVLIDLLSLIKMTAMIGRKVEGNVLEIDGCSLLETNLFALLLLSKV